VGKSEEKRPVGRHRRRWENNGEMGLKKWDGGDDWIHLAQDVGQWRAFVKTVMNPQVP
jgi:hypothetical protein